MLSLIEMSDFLRTVITICGLLVFLILCKWAYSSKIKKDFAEAEMLIFQDEEINQNTLETMNQEKNKKKEVS